MRDMYGKLNSLRSQREAGESFNFSEAIYTIIPNDGGEPKFMQPLGRKQAICDLVSALYVAKKYNDLVIAAWVGRYRTDMFLIDDIDTVIGKLEKN